MDDILRLIVEGAPFILGLIALNIAGVIIVNMVRWSLYSRFPSSEPHRWTRDRRQAGRETITIIIPPPAPASHEASIVRVGRPRSSAHAASPQEERRCVSREE